MVEFFTIFCLQFAFQLFRALGTRTIVAKHVWYTVLTTVAIQGLWLVTTYIGVMAVADMNWFSIAGYMIGGVLGSIYSFRFLKHI